MVILQRLTTSLVFFDLKQECGRSRRAQSRVRVQTYPGSSQWPVQQTTGPCGFPYKDTDNIYKKTQNHKGLADGWNSEELLRCAKQHFAPMH